MFLELASDVNKIDELRARKYDVVINETRFFALTGVLQLLGIPTIIHTSNFYPMLAYFLGLPTPATVPGEMSVLPLILGPG